MRKDNISERELDGLLSQAFLTMDLNQTKNIEIMETIANYTLIGSIPSTPSFGKMLWKKLLLISSAGVIISTIAYFSIKKNDPEMEPANNNILITTDADTIPLQDQPTGPIVNAEGNKEIPFTHVLPMKEDSPVVVQRSKQIEKSPSAAVQLSKEVSDVPVKNTEQIVYAFPNLTENEIKENNKEKEKMKSMLVKLSKSKYALIPFPNGIFYLQNAEVTNLEYRTFLFDLLIQGKKDEFFKAKPDQDLWIGLTGTHMFDKNKDVYFSDPKFNRYPVVNISAEGAVMYCKWLTSLGAEKNIEVRLPQENEWIFAAKNGMSGAYPWGTDSIQNAKNKFLANFGYQQERKKHNMSGDYPHPTCFDAYTSAGMMLGNDSIATADVYSYNHIGYGLYCMSGNVSEMVYINAGIPFSKVKTKGGNWASNSEHLKIESEDEFENNMKASPMIGFRVLVTMKK